MKTLFFLFVLLYTSFVYSQENFINKFKEFAEKYEPNYIDKNGDTLSVARIPELPKEFYKCKIKRKDIDTLSYYSFLIILKLYYEQSKISVFAYDFCYAYDNPIIKIALKKMSISKKTPCFEITTHTVYEWISKHKETYLKYEPINEILKKINNTKSSQK